MAQAAETIWEAFLSSKVGPNILSISWTMLVLSSLVSRSMVQFTIDADASIVDERREHRLRHSEDVLVYLFDLSREFWCTRGYFAVIDARFWTRQERFGHLIHLLH